MILTSENYHSKAMRKKYFGVSQYKDFCGTLGQPGCEAKALAKMNGEWEEELTLPLLIGSYIDAHFEGTLGVYKAQHPQLFKKDGDVKSAFVKANEIIARIEMDSVFMAHMAGKKQVIFTGKLFGVEWKIKIDSFLKNVAIVDLKIMAALRDSFWIKDYGYMSFVPFWGYDLQAAIYQKITEINIGKVLPFYIAAASKEKVPDIEIIGFRQQDMDDILPSVEANVRRIDQIKKGKISPDRCDLCDYCRSTKVLVKPIHFSELLIRV